MAIGPYCVLSDVQVGAGTSIEPFSYLADAIVGANCRIGPYARLRPGTKLADDVHVGNFVEVKASSLGRGSKANHLAYVGNTVVGSHVNYGAGAITANYDGAHKHQTIIGDRAIIGSNCVLVAPVTVGAGATIGAGSVIARDAPADALTVARAEQISVPGWQRPEKPPKSARRTDPFMCGIVGAASSRNVVPMLSKASGGSNIAATIRPGSPSSTATMAPRSSGWCRRRVWPISPRRRNPAT